MYVIGRLSKHLSTENRAGYLQRVQIFLKPFIDEIFTYKKHTIHRNSSAMVINMQHAHSYFCLGVHVPPGVSIWGYMFIFEGTHILELFFHSKRIEAMKSDHLDVYNSDIIML